MGWREHVGNAGKILALDHYGASAPYQVLYEQYGITADRAAAAQASLSRVGGIPGSTTGN